METAANIIMVVRAKNGGRKLFRNVGTNLPCVVSQKTGISTRNSTGCSYFLNTMEVIEPSNIMLHDSVMFVHQNSNAFLSSPIRSTRPTLPILLNFFTRIILGDEYNARSSTLSHDEDGIENKLLLSFLLSFPCSVSYAPTL